MFVCCCFYSSDELRQSKTDREELEKETERWKAEQMNERDQERLQHKYVTAAECDIFYVTSRCSQRVLRIEDIHRLYQALNKRLFRDATYSVQLELL